MDYEDLERKDWEEFFRVMAAYHRTNAIRERATFLADLKIGVPYLFGKSIPDAPEKLTLHPGPYGVCYMPDGYYPQGTYGNLSLQTFNRALTYLEPFKTSCDVETSEPKGVLLEIRRVLREFGEPLPPLVMSSEELTIYEGEHWSALHTRSMSGLTISSEQLNIKHDSLEGLQKLLSDSGLRS